MNVKKYLKNQFTWKMLGFNHDIASLFYLSSFSKTRSSVPLLCLRGTLFLGCLGILISSVVLTAQITSGKHWPIYLTHWGLVLITLTTGAGFAVSARVYLVGPIDASLALPWYVKAYWLLYSITVPIALFITLFYWSFLSPDEDSEYAVNFVLDVFIHAVNSMVMLILLFTARQPTNLLHFFYPILLGIVYLVFTIIYHFAGGLNPLGHTWIYPMLDWTENPGLGAVMTIFSAFGIFIIHLIVVAMTFVRDVISGNLIRGTRKFAIMT